MNYKVEIFFIRHGFSCTNAIEKYGGILDQPKRVFYTDPELTNYSLNNIKKFPRNKLPDVDVVMCSTMRRAEETALNLYKRRKVTVIPFVKETGNIGENMISKTPAIQRKELGKISERLNYKLVESSNGDWSKDATSVDYDQFLSLIKEIVLKRKRDMKFAVVTHSNFLKNHVFNSINKPRNIAILRKDFRVKDDRMIKDVSKSRPKDLKKDSKALIFKGFEPRDKFKEKYVRNCKNF